MSVLLLAPALIQVDLLPRATKPLTLIECGPQGVPFIIVQTKADLRDDLEAIEQLAERGQQPVTFLEAQQLGNKVRAFRVVECSALTGQGVDAVFDAAIDASLAFQSGYRHKKKCVIS